MEGSKKYTIAGRPFTQSKLTLRKDQQLFEAISDVGLSDISDLGNMTIAQIVNLLFKTNVLTKIIRIILTPFDGGAPLTDDEILDLDNDTIQELIQDFFTLNPKLLTLLKSFAGKLGGLNKIMT